MDIIIQDPLLYILEITGHSLRVYVPYKSSSPQEVEDLITLQIENALGTVKHVEIIESTSTDVNSDVFMHDFGISICSALVSSLFVALTLIPLVASRFLDFPELSNSVGVHGKTIRNPESSLTKKLTIYYTGFIELTLRLRWFTVVVTY